MLADQHSFITLVADDSENDLQIILAALKVYPEFRVVHQVHDGAAAIDYLKGEPPFDDRQRFPFPHLLICDLKMPITDGFQMLEWIRTQTLPPFVIIVLTGSGDPADAARAEALGADQVCIKPVRLDYLREAAGRLKLFMETLPKGIHRETQSKPATK